MKQKTSLVDDMGEVDDPLSIDFYTTLGEDVFLGGEVSYNRSSEAFMYAAPPPWRHPDGSTR
jgi:hypothetical protein